MKSSLLTHGGPWWRKLTLRDTIVFTLPLLVLALWLFSSAVMDYHRVRQFDDWWSSATSVRKFGWYRVRNALHSLEMGKIEKRLSAEREDLPLLRLMVDREDWDRIDEDVGGHWGEWIDVQILDGGDWYDAELRFRGDASAHWTSPKKSFTVKTRRNDLYKGFRTLAFSVKDVLPQWLVGTLAADFDLIAPEQHLAPVYLNDRFYGMYRFVEPVDEALLRRNGLVPGNVFRADTAERGDYFKGVPREVFKNPHLWDRVATNDRPSAFGAELLPRFLADLNGSSFEDHERFLAWLDRGEIARLLAFLLVVGDPYHMSGVHNQFWYEDPTSGKLRPIIWDVRLLDAKAPPRGSQFNAFWKAALRDPRIWNATLAAISSWINGDRLERIATERVEHGWGRFQDAFEYDRLREGIIPLVGDPQTTLAILRDNLAELRATRGDARVAWWRGESVDNVAVVDVEVRGLASVEFSGFHNAAAPLERIVADQDLDGVLSEGDRDVAFAYDDSHGNVHFTAGAERLLAGIDASSATLAAEPMHYRFFLVGAGASGRFEPLLGNPHSKEAVKLEPWTAHEPIRATETWHPWRYRRPEPSTVAIGGYFELTGDMVIPQGTTLAVQPGATIALRPDVSIVVRGRAEFRGTADQPITVRRTDETRPWGTIALQGEGANGSRFEHVAFLGGGGERAERVEYRGMVSVCNARDVAIDSCEFAFDQRCEDALNVARSQVSVRDSRFHDNSGDAIDFDSSEGTIEGNTIERCGADGIEITHGSPRVVGNQIAGSRARGIAIGEDAAPLVFNNTIRGPAIGVDVRDDAEPVLLHDAFVDCAIGVHAHRRNRSYVEAGWPKMAACWFRGAGAEWDASNSAKRTQVGPLIGGVTDDIVPPAIEREWLMRAYGIRTTELARGPLTQFELVEPLLPLVDVGFAEGFDDPADGWISDGRAPRVLKRVNDLQISLDRRRARIARPHDWDFNHPARTYVLVAEIGGTDVLDAELTVVSPQGNVTAPIALGDDPEVYRYTVIQLPARRYEGVMITATPFTERAQLRLHGYRVFVWTTSSAR